jgi:hypothetical protein
MPSRSRTEYVRRNPHSGLHRSSPSSCSNRLRGPLRHLLRLWVPTTPTNPRSRGHPYRLAASRRPTGFTSPGSTRVADLPAISQTGSSMGTRPSEASPRPSPPDPLGSTVLPAVPDLAAPRLRGFQLTNATVTLRLRPRRSPTPSSPCGSDLAGPRDRLANETATHYVRMRSPTTTLFTPSKGRSSPGCFPPSRMTFRPRPTFLQGSSHGLFSSTRAWDSPQGCPRASSYAQIYVRSSEFQRTGSPPGVTRASLRGVHAASHPP